MKSSCLSIEKAPIVRQVRQFAKSTPLTSRRNTGHRRHCRASGFVPDPKEDGRPREVFYSAGFKSGSALKFQIQDACVLISLLLQHGHRPEDIAKSLARAEQPDGTMAYASVTGLMAAELIKAQY
ncbi:hypothetical protein [Tateyamaria sp.]|uniref:TSCPD domain-containing protein n=1 Tax=Tateyamaria sp. TaxID=1929288 RepID=UPI003B2248C0